MMQADMLETLAEISMMLALLFLPYEKRGFSLKRIIYLPFP